MQDPTERLDLTVSAIPEIPKSTGWKEVPILECNEKLVSLNDLDRGLIVVDPKYFEQSVSNAIPVMYVREGVADKLLEAAKLLPDGYKLVI